MFFLIPCLDNELIQPSWTPATALETNLPTLWLRADQGVTTGGARQFYALDKASATLASFAAVNLSTTDFSLVSSVYRDTTGNQVIASKYQDSSNYWRWEITAGHKLHFIAVIGGVTLIEVTGATSLSSTATWYHCALAVDRDATATTKVYLNGVNDTSGTPTVSVSTIDNTGAFFIAESGAGTLYWDGRLADLGVCKADLFTQTEVTWLYNSGNSRVYGELGVAATDGSSLAPTWWANCNETAATDGIIDQASTNDLTLSFGQLIANGGFETAGAGGADVFASWGEGTAGTGTLTDEGSIVDAGSHALKMVSNVDFTDYAQCFQIVLTIGHRYTYSVRARNGGSGNAAIRLGTGTVVTLTLTNAYATYTGTVTCLAYEYFNLTVGLGSGAATAYFDTVSCVALDVPAATGPSSTGGTAVDGDPVAVWQSLEGSSYQFIQSTASKRPIYRASAINSQPGVDLDGTDDLLVKSSAILTGTASTTIIVYRLDAVPNSYQTLLASSDEATATKYVALHGRGNTANPHLNFAQRNADTEDLLDGNTTVNVDTNYSGVWASSGTTSTARLSATAQTLNADTGANSGDTWDDATGKDNVTIGALKHTSETNFASVKICEIICYPINLSSLSLTTVSAYIQSRYGVQV